MNSSSFERPKSYLFGYYLENSITAILRYEILAQSTPISLHIEGFVPFVSLSTVAFDFDSLIWLLMSFGVNILAHLFALSNKTTNFSQLYLYFDALIRILSCSVAENRVLRSKGPGSTNYLLECVP